MTQQYALYSPADQHIWNVLYERQGYMLPGRASPAFLQGLQHIGLSAERIPEFDALTAQLMQRTGFSLVAVPGIVPDREFFELLLLRQFPATTWLRTEAQLNYIEEPDMFHDVFGHVPLLANEAYANFLEGLGQLGMQHHDNPLIVELLSRIYWYTVEFGLIQEELGLRIYGAGILSSVTETSYSLGEVPKRLPFDVQTVLATPYRKDSLQTSYFVIHSYQQLYACLPELEDVLGRVAQLQAEQWLTESESEGSLALQAAIAMSTMSTVG